jgi:hypothetical protein
MRSLPLAQLTSLHVLTGQKQCTEALFVFLTFQIDMLEVNYS